jgi:hypothetical protein
MADETKKGLENTPVRAGEVVEEILERDLEAVAGGVAGLPPTFDGDLKGGCL